MSNQKISALTAATTPLAGTEVLPIVKSASTVKVSVSDLTAGRAVSTGALSVVGAATVVTSGGLSRLSIGDTAASTYSSLLLYGGSGKYNWSLATQFNLDNTFEITPSTATGGTTFNTPAFTISATTSDVNVKTGNLVIGTSGKGIDFSATSGTGTSELLADYEEGTFTVVWTNLTGTPTNTTLYYTKIGRFVFFTYPAGSASITGIANSTRFSLPFTPAQASVGAFITDGVASAGTILIWTAGVAYPTSFSSGSLIFNGSYHV